MSFDEQRELQNKITWQKVTCIISALRNFLFFTHLLSSFRFSPTIKCHGFLFCVIVWVFQWLFVVRQRWAILEAVLQQSRLLFIQLDSRLHKNLSTKSSGLIGSFSFNDLLIHLTIRQAFSDTSHRYEDSRIPLCQTTVCDFWKSCIALKRRAISQISPESLNCHTENLKNENLKI